MIATAQTEQRKRHNEIIVSVVIFQFCIFFFGGSVKRKEQNETGDVGLKNTKNQFLSDAVIT